MFEALGLHARRVDPRGEAMPVDGAGVRRIDRSWWLRTSTCGARPGVEQVCDLSVVLPCLDEAETLATCITKAQRSMKELGVDGEVDRRRQRQHRRLAGDRPPTRRPRDRRPRQGVRQRAARRHRGRRAAEFVVMADADDSYDLSRPRARSSTALRGGADLVMGNRFLGGIEPGRDADAEPIRREPGAHGVGPSVLPQPERRLPLRDARVPAVAHPVARPAHGGHGVRQRDGRAGHARQAPRSSRSRSPCRPTGARARRTFARGATAGVTSASCCCTAPAGCSSIRASP